MKGKLIVTSLEPRPYAGSEPGKGFNWAMALSKFYEVHVLALPHSVKTCQDSGLCDDWVFHSINYTIPPSQGGIDFYKWYYTWCRLVIEKCHELIEKNTYVGLHHTVLGSYRILPAYEKLGIPFTLGPLGGSESVPRNLLKDYGFPIKVYAQEYLRSSLNKCCLLNPFVRKTIRLASYVLATTSETEDDLRSAGALKTKAVFPDVVEGLGVSLEQAMAARNVQCSQISQKLNLIFSGRALWWKGGHIAIRFLERLLIAGINARLDIYSDGPALNAWKELANQLVIPHERLSFHGMVTREELLNAYKASHLFVYPTLHDSSSSSIPESYMSGLPTMTFYCGGAKMAAVPEAGINFAPQSVNEFLEIGTETVKKWVKDPKLWIQSCKAALIQSQNFSLQSIENAIQTTIVPSLLK